MKRILSIVLLLALPLAACTGSKTASALTWQEQYDLGLRYLAEGKYEEAIIAFTAAIDIDPRQPKAYASRGDAYVVKAEAASESGAETAYQSAAQDYRKALELDDQTVEFYEKLAETYLALGQPKEASEILREGVEATGSEQLRLRLQEVLRTDDPAYTALSEGEKALLDRLAAVVLAHDWASAAAMQSDGAYGALADKLPLNEASGWRTVTYYPDDQTQVSFFRMAGEGSSSTHMDICQGRGGNGSFVCSVCDADYSAYYMNTVPFAGGSVNGPLVSHQLYYDEGQGDSHCVATGTIVNGAPQGGVLFTFDDGSSYVEDGQDAYTSWPVWPEALN